jgi:histone-lysine N-methyltransferase SETMAR
MSHVLCKQRAVIEFLLTKNESITNIHRLLTNVYGDMAVDEITVSRWAEQLASSEQGQVIVYNLPRLGSPSTAVTPAIMQRDGSHIRNDWRITTRELAALLGTGKGSVDKIIPNLGYSKVCARWVPRSLTEEHKEQRKIICSELLARYEAEGDNFLSIIVTGDETWIHHFEPETKRQSMEWHHTTSPRKKKFKGIPSARKIMATVFWNCEGVILIDVLPRGQTIN